jgi:hypothetical protein
MCRIEEPGEGKKERNEKEKKEKGKKKRNSKNDPIENG